MHGHALLIDMSYYLYFNKKILGYEHPISKYTTNICQQHLIPRAKHMPQASRTKDTSYSKSGGQCPHIRHQGEIMVLLVTIIA
jgi:hypothetical protein